MKRIALLLIVLMWVCCASASASPLRDYSLGKAAFDISLADLKIMEMPEGCDVNHNWGIGITAGLGGKWALQYKFDSRSVSRSFMGMTLSAKASINELNLLYRLNKNFSAFVGSNNLSVNPDYLIHGRTTTQIGLLGTAKLARNLTGWALVATGDNNFSAEAGIGYALSKWLELNLFYANKSYSNLAWGNSGNINCVGRFERLGVSLTATF